MYHIITGGIALPICLYDFASDGCNLNVSGKDWIRAASRGVKRRYNSLLASTNKIGSREFILTFAKCEVKVKQGAFRSCQSPLFILFLAFFTP